VTYSASFFSLLPPGSPPNNTQDHTKSVNEFYCKEGAITPPKHLTEDTLLSAMESAGADDMPNDTKRKGLGTPVTRAAIIGKLVKASFAERSKEESVSDGQRQESHRSASGGADFREDDRRVGT
jgi:DNA topoisomerase IA